MEFRDQLKVRGRFLLIATTRGRTVYYDVPNLVTQFGDQWYMERAVGIGSHADVVAMKLGTGTTTPSKTGAGAAIDTYLPGSVKTFDGGFPSSGLESGQRRISYGCTWATGVATDSAITEATLTTNGNDVGGLDSDTLARVTFSAVNKTAETQLVGLWYHDL